MIGRQAFFKTRDGSRIPITIKEIDQINRTVVGAVCDDDGNELIHIIRSVDDVVLEEN